MKVCVGRAAQPRKEQITAQRLSTGKCVNRTDTEAFFFFFFYFSDVRDNVPKKKKKRREQLKAAKPETQLLLFLCEKGTV